MKVVRSKVCGRSVSRLYAVLAIFQHSHSELGVEDVFEDFLSEIAAKNPKIEELPVQSMDVEFFKELVQTTVNNFATINPEIDHHITGTWRMERLDPVQVCVLQLGICEILYFRSIPSKVILDEYTEVAKTFFTKSNVAFVNGVLNNVARKMRPDDAFND